MTTKVTQDGKIIVPWSVLRSAGFKAGDRFEITARPPRSDHHLKSSRPPK
jgi:bifunctional DNA-binding transcriptional regulator/antitoxin component of YhaV-PrlF toxin-antitoxin module